MGRRGVSLAVLAAIIGAVLPAAALPAAALPPDGADELWRDATVSGAPADHDELPQGGMHEWVFLTVQNPDGGGECGAWQAMVSFLTDVEASSDRLLFTAVVEGVPYDFSAELPYGSIVWWATLDYPQTQYGAESGSSHVGTRRFTGEWVLHAEGEGATLDLHLDPASRWRRSAPEGAGTLDIVLSPRAGATGSLRLGGRTCAVSGTGYAEHVWGNWSRVPMWGVDYLNAHLANGWSVWARRTPMRGETNLYPRLGIDQDDWWPPAMIATDGTQVFEASVVEFTRTDSATAHPDLGVPLPASYSVTGSGWTAPGGGIPPATLELSVSDPALATVLFPATSSGLLEGWGAAALRIDGGAPVVGSAEVEMQRFGTRYPH